MTFPIYIDGRNIIFPTFKHDKPEWIAIEMESDADARRVAERACADNSMPEYPVEIKTLTKPVQYSAGSTRSNCG